MISKVDFMISELALKVLTFIKNNKGATYKELETQFTNEAYMSALEHLKTLGYVNQNIPNQHRKLHLTDYQLARAGTYYITDKGKAYIEDLKKQETAEKRRVIHDWRIAIFGTVGGAVAGLITSIIFWLITK